MTGRRLTSTRMIGSTHLPLTKPRRYCMLAAVTKNETYCVCLRMTQTTYTANLKTLVIRNPELRVLPIY